MSKDYSENKKSGVFDNIPSIICDGCGCNKLTTGCFCEDVNIQTDIYNAIRGCCTSDESATEATKKAFEAIKNRLK